MVSEVLQRAREYEAKHAPGTEAELPSFHVTAPVGWINDPNGFAPYKGEYHLFFQYYPYATKWGPMHWGHVKTKDFLHWQRLPAALAPDTDCDCDGVFSGGAVEMPDGRQLLMYTGVRNVRREDGGISGIQTQCIAAGDGVNYEKHPANPVIGSGLLPEGGSIYDFRDPHIWREDGFYWCVAANRNADAGGAALLYKSADAVRWEYAGVLADGGKLCGTMWECPDFFPLDGKHLLLVCPIELPAGGPLPAGSTNVCFLGAYDKKNRCFLQESLQQVDCGLDFYAMQTLETYDGRRVMIAWLQSWETANNRPQALSFAGQMTLPRELSVRNGRLYQNPVRELESCRTAGVSYRNVLVTGETALAGVGGRYIDLTVTLRPGDGAPCYSRFELLVARGCGYSTAVCYEPAAGLLRIDRSQSGFPGGKRNTCGFPVSGKDGVLKLRLILDRYSLELFVNDGEQAASAVLYTPLEAQEIVFTCDGTARVDVEKYDIKL